MTRRVLFALLLLAGLSSGSRPVWADQVVVTDTVTWSGQGEPLPVLKELFFAPLTDANFATFKKMIDEAPVRRGVWVRTPLSPRDGLATIITDFVLRICNRYLPYTTQHREVERETLSSSGHRRHRHRLKETKRDRWLEQTIANHLRLLVTPSYGSDKGGHLTHGLTGRLDALLGSTTPDDIAINQTALALRTLEELRENPDPFDRDRGELLEGMLRRFTNEFKRELLLCYSPSKPPQQWMYNTSGKLEDQGHLKTTWDALKRLGRSKSANAPWFRAQAERIAQAYPHVLAPWSDQSGSPGL